MKKAWNRVRFEKPLEKAPYTGARACAREQSVTSIKGSFTRPVLPLSLPLSTFVCRLKRFQQVLPHRQIACKPLPAQLRAIEKDENLHAVGLTTRHSALLVDRSISRPFVRGFVYFASRC